MFFDGNNLGKRRDFHRCKRNGEWQTTENVVLGCKPNGKLNKKKLTHLYGHFNCIFAFLASMPVIWACKILTHDNALH